MDYFIENYNELNNEIDTRKLDNEYEECDFNEYDLNEYDLKDVINRISKLTTKEKIHILNILKIHNIDFTKNINGYFFNLSSVNDEVIQKIIKCLELIECNRDLIKEMDKRREQLLNYYKTLIENTLKKTIEERKKEYIEFLTLRRENNNMYIEKKRIYKINVRKIADPEEYMKDFYKSKNKYDKTSVYYKLLIKLKRNSGNSNYNATNHDDDIISISGGSELSDYISEIDNDNDNDNIDIIEDNENDKITDLEDEFDELNKDNDIISEEDINEDINDDNNIENEYDLEIEDTLIQKQKNPIRIDDMSFYKNLLSQQGFIFNEYSKCLLIYQSYIY